MESSKKIYCKRQTLHKNLSENFLLVAVDVLLVYSGISYRRLPWVHLFQNIFPLYKHNEFRNILIICFPEGLIISKSHKMGLCKSCTKINSRYKFLVSCISIMQNLILFQIDLKISWQKNNVMRFFFFTGSNKLPYMEISDLVYFC